MVNRNSVEEIRIQVDKDVAAGLYDEETGKEVIAEAIRLEDTTEPTVSRMLTPEPTPAPEPTLTAPITDDFDVIPTEAEIVQRVAEQRRDTAEVNLASHFEFDRDGFQITGVRMDEAIEAGARPQDLIAMGIEQAAIDEIKELKFEIWPFKGISITLIWFLSSGCRFLTVSNVLYTSGVVFP